MCVCSCVCMCVFVLYVYVIVKYVVGGGYFKCTFFQIQAGLKSVHVEFTSMLKFLLELTCFTGQLLVVDRRNLDGKQSGAVTPFQNKRTIQQLMAE